jgi:predicted  nucleic acid-binding Zn-ribbon protein
MSDAIVRLKVESQEYDQKLKRATEGLTRYAYECRKVGGTLEVVEKETLDYVKALGQMGTVSRTATGSLNEMKKAYTELSVEYKKLTDEEKKSDYGRALRQSLDELRGRIKDTEKDLKGINDELKGSNGLSGALDSIAGKFGLSIKQLTGWGAALAAGKVALDVTRDAFFQSESNIDEWGRTLKGAEGAYQVFLDTLNNGNWSNFFQNLETAIRGGRDLYDIFDRLGSIKSNNAAAIAIVQQQIAQLRLAKQQGENVDAQLKAATARLAQLQGQAVTAGKAAGNQAAFNVIRNGVNSIGGARVNDATIKLAVSQLMTGGQAQFDKFRSNYEILQRKGTRTVVQQLDDGMGGTVNRYRQTFDINTLTREEQKQYKIARAITEGETRIQEGISAFAQAVNEGTSAAREEFRGNRYALQGSGGSGGSRGGGGGNNEPDLSKVPFDINKAALAATKGIDGGPSDVFTAYKESLKEPTDTTNDLIEAFKKLNKAEGVDTNKQKPEPQGEYKSFSNEMANITQGVSGIVSGIEQLGIEIPQGLKSLLGGIQAVAGILTGISALVTIITAIQGTKAVPVIGWMLSHGGVVPHAANGYYVPGTHASGDVTPIMANAGELVLNKSSQGNLANDLKGAEALVQTIDRYQESIMRGSQMGNSASYMPSNNAAAGGSPYITGEIIYMGLSAYLESSGRGEIVTSRKRG